MRDLHIKRTGLRNIARIIFTLLFIMLQSACTTHNKENNFIGEPLYLRTNIIAEESPATISEDNPDEPEISSSTEVPKEKIPHKSLHSYAGSVSPPKSNIAESRLPFSHDSLVNLAVDDLILSDFISHVFANVLNVDFIVDPKIAQKRDLVTLNLEKMVSEYRLFSLVSEQLQKFGIGVQYKNGVFYIWEDKSSTGAQLGFGVEAENIPGSGRIIQLMPIHFANASNLVDFLRDSKFDAQIRSLPRENLIEVVGSRDQVVSVAQMVTSLDRPALRGRYIDRIELENHKTEVIVEKLKEILISEGIPVANKPGDAGVYLNQLEDWQALLVFAAEKNWLTRVHYWVEILDVPDVTGNKKFFVYFPKYCRALELGASLNMMMGVSQESTSVDLLATSSDSESPGKSRESRKSAQSIKPNKSDETKSKLALTGNALSMGESEFNFGVDENRNALIFYTTGEQYRKLQELLQRLDIQPLQVLLEVTLAEVTLKDDLAYGLEWYLKNKYDDGNWVSSTLGGLGLGSSGFNFSYINLSEKFKLAINAFAKDELVKILSTPRLMVRDGASASFNIGTEVPVLLSETSVPDLVIDGNSGVTQSVQYRTTGITLNVTPTVHAQGTVTLIITQVVSEAQTNTTSSINSPLILNREITTEVVATDNQTVVLAGLIKDNTSTTETKVPWIGDLPLIGNFFKTTSTARDRTELVIMITPHIVRSHKEVEMLQQKIFDSFEWLTTNPPVLDVLSP